MFEKILHFLDPLRWFGGNPDKYSHFWLTLFTGIFYGVGAKIISVFLILFGFWLLARREQVMGFFLCIFFSLLFAYLGGFFHVLYIF